MARDQVLSLQWCVPDMEMIRSLGVRLSKQSVYNVALNSVLTEAMLAHAEGRWVSFSRHKDYYTGLTRYRGPAHTYTNVLRAIDELVHHELIAEERSSPHQRGRQSRLRATPRLVERWNRVQTIYVMHEIIRLRDIEGNLVDYRDTNNTRRMRSELERLNADLATISVELIAADVIRTPTHLRIDGQLYRQTPPFLFRSFSRQSFAKGGRAYGWWQNLPKVHRSQLLINGEPTAEPDFIQMHPSMLYAERGLTLNIDAYRIADFPREIVKLAFQILLNTASRQGAVSALMNKEEWPLSKMQTSELISALRQHHKQIATDLHADRGIDLMRRDSEIILRTLRSCLRSGIPALPIHDSMLTPRRYESRVAELMERSATELLGTLSPCKVKVSGFSVPQTPPLLSFSLPPASLLS